MLQGVERFGKYFRKKGWIGKGEKDEAEREVKLRRRDRAWNVGEGGVRWVVEFATAYAIVKMLIPVRIVFSVWATPWFAERTVVPVGRAMARWFGRGSSKAGGSGAAGTGATGGKVIEKVKKPGNGEGG